MTVVRSDAILLTAAQAAVVYEEGSQPALPGTQGRDQDGNSYVLVRLTGDVSIGGVVSEKRVPIKAKSVKSIDPAVPGMLRVTTTVAASTDIVGPNEIGIYIDTAHSDVAQRLFRVENSQEIRNTGTASADVDTRLSLRLFDTADDVLGQPQFPKSYQQATANAVEMYRIRGLNGQETDLSVAVNAGESYDILGIAQRAITATSSAPRYAWLATSGIFYVDASATAGDSGIELLADLTAGGKGKVRVTTGSIARRFPVGVALEKFGSAGLVLARLSIESVL